MPLETSSSSVDELAVPLTTAGPDNLPGAELLLKEERNDVAMLSGPAVAAADKEGCALLHSAPN